MNEKFLKIVGKAGITKIISKTYDPYSLRIVCFHSVCPNHEFLPNWLYIRPDNFESQLKSIADYFNVICFNDLKLVDDKKIINPLIITFDDGLVDNYEFAFPALKKLKLKATFFLNSIYLMDKNKILWTHNLYILSKILGIRRLSDLVVKNKDKNYDFLSLFNYIRINYTYEEIMSILKHLNNINNVNFNHQNVYMDHNMIRELIKYGMDVGSHGYSHYYLPKVKDLFKEAEESKEILSKITGKSITSFAYPFGDPLSFSNELNVYFGKYYNNMCTTIPMVNKELKSKVFGRVCSYEMKEEKIILKLLLGK